ncbi:ErmE/ErmH/ErmO/ErmR family 23S rRNA (adenine(2058)-N(6))-methyltransferase [Lipingzhangella sp. LS1_29]|uniref:ErmE/ErmH/ErmO/ErmR family 23S rRNA (Adenine(2058)-N(6))-methyltransferase n=1 Tax=Lipingzhangella rawalii TaxID=2055835 RepID=A0ABU2H2T3_9ACTN|nr:ErmE/ErmH/ErmO/ErmR family 23S rRNA (adenine(2058)-N(6))-methyltransferase [Lipingzhangella rawalii]
MSQPARRALSQNFLVDSRVAHAVVRTAGDQLDLPTLEIGAGTGALTRLLAPRCRKLTLHERDPELVAQLRRRFAQYPRVRCVQGDFLRTQAPRTPFTVVGNIPYARTSAIVNWCLEANELRSATLVTQLEYARKRTGEFGTWTRVTVLSWPEFEWRLVRRVPRHSFRPVPRVDSAILQIRRRSQPLVEPRSLPGYRQLVRLGFSGRGGGIGPSLRQQLPRNPLHRALAGAGVEPTTPVGLVAPQQWQTVFHMLRTGGHL